MGEGRRGFIRDPAPGKAAPPLSLSASAPRIFPSLWRRWMGRSATLQQRQRRQLLLPSPRGCPGGHCRQPPTLRSLGLARKDPTRTALGKRTGVCSAPLPASPPTPAASGQGGIRAEKAPAAARKRRPGRCCYPTPPTPSRCNALGPASARLLPGDAGLVRVAVCRCGSSPLPRCPPPPRVPRPPPSQRPLPPPLPRPPP